MPQRNSFLLGSLAWRCRMISHELFDVEWWNSSWNHGFSCFPTPGGDAVADEADLGEGDEAWCLSFGSHDTWWFLFKDMCIAFMCDICGEESSWMMCFRCCMIFCLFPFSMARSDRLYLQPGWDTLYFSKFPRNANWTPRCHDSWSEIRISTRKNNLMLNEVIWCLIICIAPPPKLQVAYGATLPLITLSSLQW